MTSDLWGKKPRNYQKGVVLFFRGKKRKERKLKAETLNLGERITTLNSAVRKIVLKYQKKVPSRVICRIGNLESLFSFLFLSTCKHYLLNYSNFVGQMERKIISVSLSGE